jgi:hypothetical protein
VPSISPASCWGSVPAWERIARFTGERARLLPSRSEIGRREDHLNGETARGRPWRAGGARFAARLRGRRATPRSDRATACDDGAAVVTCRLMVRRAGGRRVSKDLWLRFALAAAVVFALASCDKNQVVTPPASGVFWTRLTPTSFSDCLWPDVRFDSLVYSTVQLVPIGDVNGDGTGDFGLRGRIAVSGIDGANPVRIGFPGPANWNSLRPRWVASQQIVFMDNRSGTYDVWYQALETFDDYRLTNFPTHETAPTPRPGTAGIVYVELSSSATSPYDYGRLVLIPDTTAAPLGKIYLTPDTLSSGDPDWDPTGTKLCFTVQDNNDFTRHIYTMNLAPGDSVPTQITVGPAHDFQPRWSPDGGRIAFTSDRTSRWGIWVVHPLGEAHGLRLVSFDDPGAECFTPTWTPDGMGLIVSSNGRGGVRSLWLLSNLPVFPF